jgi:hypothetical protein
MSNNERQSTRELQCAHCGETLQVSEPKHAKSHVPPIPDEFVTPGEGIDHPADAAAAFSLAEEHPLAEGAVIHIGGSQRLVRDGKLNEQERRVLDAIHKIRPFSPYDGECVNESSEVEH